MVKLGDKEGTTNRETPVIVALNRGRVCRRGSSLSYGELIQSVIRIVEIVAIELVPTAVELVGSGLGGDHNLAAATAPEGRIVVATRQGELLDGVNARRVQQSRIGAAVIDVGAVHGPVVSGRARAVDGNRTVAGQTKSRFIAQLVGDSGLE